MSAGPRRVRLFTPGPVEIPVRVLRALSQVPPHHRTEVFRDTLRRVLASLKELHGTAGEVLLLAASGTGAMEAAVVNFLAPGERALVAVGGKFGQRWVSILKAYGVAHQTVDVAWGESLEPAAVGHALDADPALAAVFCTHSETSTGALHDVEGIAREARARGRRVIVDAVTSLGVHPLPQDAWGIDVVVCGSQKGLMVPPGIATLGVSAAALPLVGRDALPRFYFDLRRAIQNLPLGETAFTPPVSLVLALEEALAMIREEGLDAVHARHRKLAHAMQAGAQALGFARFAKHASHAVTALKPPSGVDAAKLVRRLREVHGMVVAGGQDQLKGVILRVGHMGAYDLADIHALLGALEECVGTLGGHPAGGASAAATRAWETA
ncbi:MAG TPA: alanine--glyoxylate aminotransferase family protein [Candidatus Saccharimonadaceae bacterium]|jgi:aspartate aminotransferase-like enzyme|nr:alanine--glyoxylate aminotransferase family protein [Candidatus Saccharimonadaceae bacterium]